MSKTTKSIDYLKLLQEGYHSKDEILAMMKKPTLNYKCSDCGEDYCYGVCEIDRCNCKAPCKSKECLGTVALEIMSERNYGHTQYYVVQFYCMECERIGCMCCKQCKLFHQCNCHGQLENDDDSDYYSDYDERDTYDTYNQYDAELEYEAQVEYNSRLGYDAYDPELEDDVYDPEHDAYDPELENDGSYEEYIRQRDAARDEERRQFNCEMDRLEREDEEREREEYEREEFEREDEKREMYELDTDPVMCTRLTCEYRPEEEVHDIRFDILSMDLDDPFFIPNPVLEDYDARLEQEYIRCEEERKEREEAECEEREEFDIHFTPEHDKTVSVSRPSITVASLSNESIIRAHAVEIVKKERSRARKLNPDHPDYEMYDDIDSDSDDR
jgi:hypothetical protein